jgi:hypothetical protein
VGIRTDIAAAADTGVRDMTAISPGHRPSITRSLHQFPAHFRTDDEDGRERDGGSAPAVGSLASMTDDLSEASIALDSALTSLAEALAVAERALKGVNAALDDEQLANVDLQNILQKQQQTLQMMSNISKMLFDTAMAIIRKLDG